MNIFNNLDYRTVLKIRFTERKMTRSATTLEAMSNYCRIQKPYLSKVFNHHGNLNRDQLYLASEYLGFNESENQFLVLLHDFDQCSLEKRKAEIKRKIEKLQSQFLKSESHLNSKVVAEVDFTSIADYYSDPFHQLVHIFLTIERFQKNVSLIAKQLDISVDQLEIYMDNLERFKIIERSISGVRILVSNLHLPANAKVIKAYKILSRVQALHKIGKLDDSNDYSFNVVLSCDLQTRTKIQEKFLVFLKEVQTLVGKSEEKDVFQLGFDLIKWS